MYKKRATLLTFNSLTNLPKVCYRYPNSIKNLTLLRNFSTATERSDFDNFSGLNDNEHGNGFYENDRDKYYGQDRNWNFRGNNGHFQASPDGFYGGNSSGVYQQNPPGVYQQNSPGVYGKPPKVHFSERQQDPVGQNGILRNNSCDSFSSFKTGFQQNPNGRNGNFASGYADEGHRNEFQQSPVRKNANFGRGSYEIIQESSSGIRLTRDGKNGNFTNGYPAEGHKNEFLQSSIAETAHFGNGGSVEAQQNLKWSYGPNPVNLQTSSYSGGNGGVSQQNAGSYNVANLETSRQNSQNFYYNGSPGNFQHMPGKYNVDNAGMHQQTFNVMKENDESTAADEDMKLKGTIEELDRFLREGELEVVVEVLGLLEKQGVPVDLPRYLALMKACGEEKALEEAKSIHDHLMRSMPNLELSTYNTILEMYSKCGSMEDAYNVFDKMPQRNLTSWDALIIGLAKNGQGETAIDMFTEFKELGLKPDGQMYLGVFNACSALLDTTEGMLHFEAMSKDHGIVPSMEHYVSVVNLLGSTGHLDEALEFIEKMPIQPSVEVWETLMNLSRIHGNTELGDRCAELVELLDPSRLSEQSRAGLIPLKVSDLAKEKEKKKSEGQNPLEVRSRVHEYRAGDRSHPDHEKLYALLGGLKHQMKEAGYIPETKFVLHDIDQEAKEEALLGHSERLAVSKGLMNTPARSTMRIIKNLRVCGDCHNAMKIISKLVGRELIMRDAKRFHHFKDGVCSCRDYW